MCLSKQNVLRDRRTTHSAPSVAVSSGSNFVTVAPPIQFGSRPPAGGLSRLAEGEASVNDLAEPFDLTLPAISRHIKVLEHAGLITQGRRAQFRPCTIAPAALAEVADWTDQYRHIWDDRFDRMDHYVRHLQNTKREKSKAEKEAKSE